MCRKFNNIEELIQEVSMKELAYNTARLKRKKQEASCKLEADWKFINTLREEDDLPKITNQSQRDAYIENQIIDLREEEANAQAEYNHVLMIYENRETLGYVTGGK